MAMEQKIREKKRAEPGQALTAQPKSCPLVHDSRMRSQLLHIRHEAAVILPSVSGIAN